MFRPSAPSHTKRVQSLIRAKEPQGSHGVGASSGVASIYGKGGGKHVQTRRSRFGFRAEGTQDYWLNVGVEGYA